MSIIDYHIRLIKGYSFGNFNANMVVKSLRENQDIVRVLFFLIHPSRLKQEDVLIPMYQLQKVTWDFINTIINYEDQPRQTGLLIGIEKGYEERTLNLIESWHVDRIESIKDKVLMLWWD